MPLQLKASLFGVGRRLEKRLNYMDALHIKIVDGGGLGEEHQKLDRDVKKLGIMSTGTQRC